MRAVWMGLLLCACTWNDATFGEKAQREFARISALCDEDADTDPGVQTTQGAHPECEHYKVDKAALCIAALRTIKRCPADGDVWPRECEAACGGPEVAQGALP